MGEGSRNRSGIRNGLQTLSKGWRGKGPSNEGGAVEGKLQPGERGQADLWVVEVAVAEVEDLLPLPLARPRPLDLEGKGARLPLRLVSRKELLAFEAGSLLLKAVSKASREDFTTFGAAS